MWHGLSITGARFVTRTYTKCHGIQKVNSLTRRLSRIQKLHTRTHALKREEKIKRIFNTHISVLRLVKFQPGSKASTLDIQMLEATLTNMETSRKVSAESRLALIVVITAISYFLYYYLQIHTITTQKVCTYLDEFWLSERLFFLSPLGLFATTVLALSLFTLSDVIYVFVGNGQIKILHALSYMLVLS